MKKIFKKNQIIVTVLAILIVIAGYLKYTDANFNNKNKEVTNEIYESTYGTDDILSNGEIASLDENETGEAVEETTLQPGEAVMTSSQAYGFYHSGTYRQRTNPLKKQRNIIKSYK